MSSISSGYLESDLTTFYNEFIESNQKSTKSNLSNDFDHDLLITKNQTEITKNNQESCPHLFTNQLNSIETCTSCGLELSHDLSLNDESRWYGANDNKNRSDPSRCFFRKNDEKTIFRDLLDLNLPKSVMEEANMLFSVITQNKIQRGNTRKAIIFACVYNAYKDNPNPQTPDDLQAKFKLTKKEVSKGLNYYNLHIGKMKKPAYITAEHVIPKIVSFFSSKPEDIENVRKLYEKIKNKSDVVIRSTPKSTICGLVFYYYRINQINIPSTEFATKVGLSVVTIIRLAKAVADILGTRGQVKLA